MSEPVDRTRTIQREASDPAVSAWVVANAGSGKTHVLTQRVIRLLLAGADPSAILCLTFTKAAAAEMARRVFGRLGHWATLADTDLAADIADLEGRAATGAELRRARQLFACALETPGGLKIQTIHAFCEKLLHQFPFEANVPGRFAVLDDNAAAALIAEARAETVDRAASGPETKLGRAMRALAENASDMQIGEALDAIIAERGPLRRWMDIAAGEHGVGTVDDALADLRRRLGLQPHETEESICQEICQAANWRCDDCRALADALVDSLESSPHNWNARAHPELAAIFAAEATPSEADARVAFFLSWNKGEKEWRANSQRFGRAFEKSRPGLAEALATEAERLLALVQRLDLARAYAATEALLVVGDAILQAYHAAKRQAGMLDFADLIAKTRNLLARADAAAWVLYKLDQRIDHILVDEAQDTSPDQWAVVRAIAEDFFAGAGARQTARTIFAVGDDKQSIFGFQGAAPKMLAEMRRTFAARIAQAGAKFVELPLFLSFRSTREILHAVDHVFAADLVSEITASDYTAHASHRDDAPGQVVILPRIIRAKHDDPEDWSTPFDAPPAAETELAQRIADEIVRLRETTLPSGKDMRYGSILVLVRKRDAFVAAMHRALRSRRIATAGADRVPVATHIAVLDLLALADVVLLPQDDLQLAACLKSPLLGIDEDMLMRLAAGRTGSLWATLRVSQDEKLRPAAERLLAWRRRAGRVTPFRFFATVLGPDGGRRAFRARLGDEADDVLDAFLSQALAFEAIGPPSLQGFAGFIRANQSDIKRETEEAAAGVRIMTVHGAKGLEADVVFLVDTGGLIVVHNQRDKLVAIGDGHDDPAFLWRRLDESAPPQQRQADALADQETRSEYLRLLYVAMTRARDMLYVAGIKGATTDQGDPRWHKLVERALVPADAPRDAETGELAAPYVWPQPARPAKPAAAQDPRAEAPPMAVPDWLDRPLPSPPAAPRPLRPSRALAEPDFPMARRNAFADGGSADGEAALRYGRLVHRLLDGLPARASKERATADRLLGDTLPAGSPIRAALILEAQGVIAEPALAACFGPDSRAEVPIVGRVATATGDYAVSGRIDRLVREAGGWHILDFKTNRLVPPNVGAADPAAILQLALYRRVLQAMEPEVSVRATLVWTAGPKIMPIPAEIMEQALASLAIRAMPVP